MTLAEASLLLQQLASRMDAVEARLGGVEAQTKIEKTIKQIVFEREAGVIKARVLVQIKTATGVEERWEDRTDLLGAKAMEVLNGA